MTRNSKTSITTRNTGYIAGTKKRFTALSTILLHGVPYTTAAIVSALQAEIDTADAVVPANAAWRARVAAAKTARLTVGAFLPAYEAYVRNTYGEDAEALADFGLAPKTPHPATAATKAEAAQKATATRAAGGTKSKKSKAAPPAPAAPAPVK
ncbi:MAG TPA: hypothetical protein VIF09_10130 [Polyangiaceae bacterium]|jgi:hypothetical protein